jgi:hypothetical protein
VTSGKAFTERDDEKIAWVSARGGCAESGPWGTVCTQDAGHRYSHYDAQDDSSWQDDWREWLHDDDEDECPL